MFWEGICPDPWTRLVSFDTTRVKCSVRISKMFLRMACPIPIIPSAMILNMMKNKMYKKLKYLETPKGILVIFNDLNDIVL